ncbi:MAG: hypothetical protein HDT34_02950 [Clostridiales bacterium]|nr:hypothetical protein [Clostridiales bacterium]
MNIEIRYQSRGGNTKAMAEVIAEHLGIKAYEYNVPIETDYVDILFVGGGLYYWQADKSFIKYIENLDRTKIGLIVPFSTSGGLTFALNQIEEAVVRANIPVSDDRFCLKLYLQGHGLLKREGGHLTNPQIAEIQDFVDNIISKETELPKKNLKTLFYSQEKKIEVSHKEKIKKRQQNLEKKKEILKKKKNDRRIIIGAIVLFIVLFAIIGFGDSSEQDDFDKNNTTSEVNAIENTTELETESTIEVTTETTTESTTQTTIKETTTLSTTKKTTQKTTNTTTKTTKKAVTTTKRITTTERKNSRTVYITPKGERYHYSEACAGKNAIATNLDSVGYRDPCKKCVG